MGRPNAGGGRKNQGKNNVSSRARFSDPPKNIIDRFKKKSAQSAVRSSDDAKQSNRQSKSGGAIRDMPLDKKIAGEKALERLNMDQKLLTQLLTLFEGPRPEAKNPTVRIPQPPSSKPPSSAPSKIVVDRSENMSTKSSGISTTKTATLPFSLSSKNSIDSLSPVKPKSSSPHSIYEQYGFLPAEILKMSRIVNCVGDNDHLLALLIFARNHSLPEAEVSRTLACPVLGNEELRSELEVLESIYGCDVLHEFFLAFKFVPCCRISVLLSIGDSKFEVRIFVLDCDKYPSLNSKLYGWLVDPASESLLDGGVIDATALRSLSLNAMELIQSRQIQLKSPVAFDFVQSLNETVTEKLSKEKTKSDRSVVNIESRKGNMTAKSTPAHGKKNSTKSSGRSGILNDNKNSQKNSKSKMKKLTTEDKEPCTRFKLPEMPVTFHIKGMEYKGAFGSALRNGLSGRSAQAAALEELEFILPTSALNELRLEIAYAEAKLDQSFSITRNVSTKETIEGAKKISEMLNVNKASGKALFQEGKDKLLLSGDEYARTAPLLLKKIVDCAVDIHKKRAERKEEKRKEKQMQKTQEQTTPEFTFSKHDSRGCSSIRGMTIRDAYDVVEASKKSGRDDASDSEEGSMHDTVELNEISTCIVDDFSPLSTQKSLGVPDGASRKISEAEVKKKDIPLETFKKERTRVSYTSEELELESRRLRNLLNNKRCMSSYKEWLKKRMRLPAFQMKKDVLDAIRENSVVVISGDTGCGKTTQVPQLVLDEFIDNGCGALCNIIVTQPRRISAVSVAEQIARERAEKVGQSVGYHIRLESVKTASTRLLLMTTGVLLRQLQADDCSLEGISHIFVDEVHERDINTDFLLIVLKKMLTQNPHIKVVLMSATLNANLFIDYFNDLEFSGCTLINIPGRAFPVNDFYLEDVLEQTKHEICEDSEYAIRSSQKSSKSLKNPSNFSRDVDEKEYRKNLQERNLKEQSVETLRISKKYSRKTLDSLKIVDESIINLELIQHLVGHILTLDDTVVSGENVGAILIFVPGLADIRNVIECLNEIPEISGSGSHVRVLPLHSSLSSQEQARVFQILPNRKRKIVVSTNIAETSVTIEDVVFVIDTCRVKENSYDEESQMNVLQEEFISQANARQRRGRAGRVRSGVCFHLISRHALDSLPPFTVPEMLRMSLEDLILQVLALDLGDPYTFLGEALSPPSQTSITGALLFLDSLSAVSLIGNQYSGNTSAVKVKDCLMSEITPLGFHLAALPLSPRLGKLLLYGVLLKCLDPILTIISVVSAKSPFVSSFDQRNAADAAKQTFFYENSDLLSAMHAFDSWKVLFSPKFGRKGNSQFNKEEDIYCRTNYLSSHSLRLIDQMRGQFLDLLVGIGFVPEEVTLRDIKDCDENSNGANINIIKCALCAGLSPNILTVPSSSRDGRGNLNKNLLEIPLTSYRKGHPISVHPSSIMSESKLLDSNFLAYLEAMKTSKVYARDVTTISPIILALFCGKLSTNSNSGVVVVNGWISFTAVPDLSKCLKYIREEMENAFIEKVLNPGCSQQIKWNKVLNILKQM